MTKAVPTISARFKDMLVEAITSDEDALLYWSIVSRMGGGGISDFTDDHRSLDYYLRILICRFLAGNA